MSLKFQKRIDKVKSYFGNSQKYQDMCGEEEPGGAGEVVLP